MDYIQKTVAAYDDTQTFEDATKDIIPEDQIMEFLAHVSKGAKILDAGCAFGRDTAFIASHGYEVHGIDLSEPMIARARELHPEITFAVADVRTTGLPGESFDAVWSNATLLHLKDEDILVALREFHRLLKPGGVIGVSFKRGEGTSEFVEDFSSKSPRFYNFKTTETLTPLLERAGFELIKATYTNSRHHCGPDSRELIWLNCLARKE